MTSFSTDKSHLQLPSGTMARFWPETAGLAFFAIAYWLVVRLGLMFVARPEGVASIWPASGLGLAILLLSPKRQWAKLLTVIFITNAAGNWSGGNSLLVSLGFALANTLESALAAWVLKYFCKSKISFGRIVEIFSLFGVAILSNGITALLGAAVPALAFGAPFMNTWRVWWAADGLGMLLVTPVIVTWVTCPKVLQSMSTRRLVEAIFLACVLAVFAWLLFGPFTIAEKPLLRNYMLFPILIWLAFRFRPRGMASVLSLFVAIAIWNTLQGYGIFAFADQTNTEHLASLQIFLSVAVFSGLVLSAMITEERQAKEAQRLAEVSYRASIENAPTGIFQSTPQGRFRSVNPAMARIFGYDSPEEMIARITDVGNQIYVNPSDRQEFQRQLAEHGEVLGFIGENYCKDGSIIWTQTTARAERDAQGKVLYYEGFLTDVTQSKQAEEEISRMALMLDIAPNAITVHDFDGRFIYANQSAFDLHGYDPDEFMSLNLRELDAPDSAKLIALRMQELLDRGEATFQVEHLKKDGTLLPLEIYARLTTWGNIKSILNIATDITARKRAEEALREQAAELQTIMETVPAIVSIAHDQMCQVITGNRALYELLHMPSQSNTSLTAPASQRPTHFKIYIDGIDPPPNELPLQVSAATGVEIREIEEDIVFDDGRVIHILGNAVPLFDKQGRPRGAVAAFVDITERVRAEEALRESEAKMRKAQHFARVGSWTWNIKTNHLDWSDEMYRIFGVDKQTFSGSLPDVIAQTIHPDDRAKVEQSNLAVINEGKPSPLEYRIVWSDGSIHVVWAEAGEMIRDNAGAPSLLSGTVQEITERVQAEEALRQAEAKYHDIFENAIEGIFQTTPAGKFFTANPALARMLGYNSPEELIAGVKDLNHEFYELPARRDEFIKQVSDYGMISNFESKVYRKDGSTIWISENAQAVSNDAGQVLYYEGTLIDITERKRAEEALGFLSTRQEAILAAVPDIIMEVDNNKVYTWANRAGKEFFGEGVIGKDAAFYFLGEQDTYSQVKPLFNGSEDVIYVESWQRRQDGEERLLAWWCRVLKDAGGNVTGALSTAHDITERKQVEEKLIASEVRYRRLFEAARDGILILDAESGVVIDVNPFLIEMLGFSREEICGKELWELGFFKDIAANKANFLELQQKEYIRYEDMPLETADGRRFHVEFVSNVYQVDHHKVVQCNIRDITERKRAEERFRALIENSTDMVRVLDPSGMTTYVSPSVQRIMGYAPKELVGHSVFDLIHPEDLARIRKGWQVVTQAPGPTPKVIEARVRHADGTWHIHEAIGTNLLNEPSVGGFVMNTRDITERKRAEDEILEKSKELEALFTISSHLRTAQTAGDMLPVVLTQMSKVLNADANAVILLDPDQTHFTYVIGDGLLTSSTGLQFDVENSISGRILQTRQPYVTLDFANDSLRSRAIRDSEGIGAAAIVPLQSETEFIGTLLCARAKDSHVGPFTSAEVKLLVSIGEMVGTALRRVRLYDDALSRLQRVQALRSIDSFINANMDINITLKFLVSQTLLLMKIDAAAVLFYNSNLHMLECAVAQGFHYRDIEKTRFELDSEYAGRAVTERRIIMVPDLSNTQDPGYREMIQKEGFVAGYMTPMIAKGKVLGVVELYSRAPFHPNQEWLDFIESLGAQAAIAIDNIRLFRDLQTSNLELSLAYDATIQGWSQALDLKDRETEGHTIRVTEATVSIARLAGLSENEIMHIRRGALLHDIGKMGIPDRILNKTGRLTPKEWEIMRQHPQYAYNMLHPVEFLRPALDIPYYHHERWDGTGYPHRLQNVQIPFAARLFAVVDVWDAVTHNRIYRKAWSYKKTLAHIQKQSGKHFDPQVVDLFLKFMDTNASRNK